MRKLLMKEFRLALHPTVLIFWMLSAMLLIPNYPYYVITFYTALGLYFVCLTGRENHDIEYSLTLPVRKADLVKARFVFAVIVEMVQLLIAIPFACVRQKMPLPGNLVGMDANLAFFGFALLLYGLFNRTFFAPFFRNPQKVGRVFAFTSIGVFVIICVLEAMAHAIPFVRDRLDTPDPAFLGEKLLVLAAGAFMYAVLTMWSYKKSKQNFETLDL